MQTAYSTTFPEIYRGIVEDNVDPKNLGRCKVRVPGIHGDNTNLLEFLPWAEPIVLSSVSKGRGSINIPDIGDWVWVLFEGARKEYPLYFGGFYSNSDGLDVAVDGGTQRCNKVTVYTEDGNAIVYDRESKSYTISIDDKSITIDSKSITINGDTIIEGDLNVSGDMTITGDLLVDNDAYFSKDIRVKDTVYCTNIVALSGEGLPGGSMNLGGFERMSEEEFQQELEKIKDDPGSFLYWVKMVNLLVADQAPGYYGDTGKTIDITLPDGRTMTVRPDCSGMVNAAASLYMGKTISNDSYGYIAGTGISTGNNAFTPVTDGKLEAGDVCARGGHVEIYAYTKDGVDYVYSGGSNAGLASVEPRPKQANTSYDAIWRYGRG